jgi:hypothetical protein
MKLILLLLVVVVVMVISLPALEGLGKISERRRSGATPGVEAAVAKTQPRIERAAHRVEQPSSSETGGSMYQWRDADGTVHIESNPPADGNQYETIHHQKSTATVPKDTSPAATVSERLERSTEAVPQASSPLSVYTPEGMAELMKKVDETARQLDSRDKLMEDLSKQL